MDGRGYVKLVDFGLAKQIVSGSTWYEINESILALANFYLGPCVELQTI